MLLLGETLALKETGVDAAQRKAENAKLEGERIVKQPDDDAFLEEELATLRQERSDADEARKGELNKRIKEIEAVLKPTPKSEPTVEALAPTESIPARSLINQVEIRLAPPTEDAVNQETARVDADVTKYTEQVAHISENIRTTRGELEATAIYDPEQGVWIAKEGLSPERDQALADSRRGIRESITNLDATINDQIETGLIFEQVWDEGVGDLVLSLDEDGAPKKIAPIPATRGGYPRKGSVHPVTREALTKDDRSVVLLQRKARKVYKKAIQTRANLQTQLAKQREPQEQVNALQERLNNAEGAFQSINEGDVEIEQSLSLIHI